MYIRSKSIVDGRPEGWTGVEEVAKGYYRFHLPERPDESRVQELMRIGREAAERLVGGKSKITILR